MDTSLKYQILWGLSSMTEWPSEIDCVVDYILSVTRHSCIGPCNDSAGT